PEQDVLGADVVVVEHPRFFLREDDHAASTVREPLEHDTSPNERGRVSSRLTTPTPRFCRCSPQAERVSRAHLPRQPHHSPIAEIVDPRRTRRSGPTISAANYDCGGVVRG